MLPRVTSWGISQMVKFRKKRVGLKAKRLFDYGRSLFIRDRLGMEIQAIQYCDPIRESPENVLLIGRKVP